MRIKYQVVAFDAADIESESAFWAGVLGGEVRVLQPAQGATEGDDFQVYADPAGHPFCLCFLVGDASAHIR
jgi:hypothetical protein